MELTDDIRTISGIGDKYAKTLAKLEIRTVGDLLYYLPRAYRDYSNIQTLKGARIGERALFEVRIFSAPKTRHIRKGLEITSFLVSDESELVNVDIFNQKHIKQYIQQDNTIYIYGMLTYQMKKLVIAGPEIFFKKPTDPLFPIYPLTAGLKQAMLRKFVKTALEQAKIGELYSNTFLERFRIPPLKRALRVVHFPQNEEEARKARARLVFDELLIFCRMIELLNEEQSPESEIVLRGGTNEIERFVNGLEFTPTDAQRRIMTEIAQDLGGGNYMNRLVQGDVGSGKTAISFFAMDCMAQNGYQSVMMAPTEILAEQHYSSAKELFGEEALVLILGSQSTKQREEALQRIADGSAKIIIGTHALIYGNIEFHKLGLLITDEQHRFGVKQRAALAGTADIHSLVMSATPIPRSLALVLYGKTDISILDELPPGRKSVKTYLIHENKYQTMIDFIGGELDAGRQAYIVCPLIEEDDDTELRSAEEVYAEIGTYYPDKASALLHGRMKSADKQRVMQAFADGEIQVLVATTVIEVGVNVAHASVMVVLNAERFGLAQLHQLRGRVGRGIDQSYCFLVSDYESAYERLKVMVQTNDGFEIAERDMQFRGTGDIFGTRQHGQSMLKISNLIQDAKQLEKAKKVLEILRTDCMFHQEYAAITQAAKQATTQKMVEIALN